MTVIRELRVPRWGGWSLPLAGALLLGTAMILVAGEIGVLAVVALAAGTAGVVWPDLGMLASVLQVAIPPQYLSARGGALDSANNLILMAGVGAWILLRGINRFSSTVLWGWVALFALTFTLSSPYPDLGTVQPIKTLIGFALGPILYCLDFPVSVRQRFWRLLPSLAPFNVVVGIVLAGLGAYSLYRVDYDGSLRLQGATIPANLASMALAGVLIGLHGRIHEGRRFYLVMALVNFGLIGLSGTRGALAAAALALAVYVWPPVRSFLRGRVTQVGQLMLIAIVVGLILMKAVPIILERTFESGRADALSINTSGRLIAWLFFWRAAEANLVFGRGLGAGTIVNAGALDSFRVPHNEYLRLVVDGGFVGLAIMGVAFVLLLRSLDRRLSGRDRTMFRTSVVATSLLAVIGNPLSTPQFSVPIWLYFGLLRQDVEQGRGEIVQ